MQTFFEIEPAYRQVLTAAGLTDFEALMRANAGDPTSKHLHRETVPILIPVEGRERQFFLKRVFKVPFKHAVWPWLRREDGRSQPHREWLMLDKLRIAGIRAMNRVAYGERRSGGLPRQAFLLVEKVPLKHTLEDWLVSGFPKPAQLSAFARGRLLSAVGLMLGRLHSAGFLWPDIHAKHVFAASPAPLQNEEWELCLIDVERMIQVGPDRAAAHSLREWRALMKSLQPSEIGNVELEQAWEGYRQSALQLDDSVREVLRADELPRLPDDYVHPRSSRTRRGKDFWSLAEAEEALGHLQLRTIDDVFTCQAGRRFTKPGLARFRERIQLETPGGNGNPRRFFLKRYERPPLAEQLRRMREGNPFVSLGCHESRMIKRLNQLGVPTMRWVACGQSMQSGIWELRSFGITEGLNGISLETLVESIRRDKSTTPSVLERREIIRQTALVTRRLHRSRLFHRDFYLCHLFLTRNADGGIVVRVIDLARMLEKPVQARRWKVKDLAALDFSAAEGVVTRADRIRFLFAYDQRLKQRGKLRTLLQQIRAKARRIAHHDNQRRSAAAGMQP